MMMNKPKVLITGASRGIGLAIAQRLSAEYSLLLHASRETDFPEIEGPHQWLCADFSDAEATKSFCATLKREHGEGLYAVINNAGLTLDKSLVFQPEKDIDRLINVNLKAPILLSKTALKLFLLQKRGVILNMSSVVAANGNAFQSVYAATKAGLEALSKSLAREVAAVDPGANIRCLSVAPGFIETDMTRALPDVEKAKYKTLIPSGRFGTSGDVADLVAFLLSDAASFINGSTLHVNGGMF